MQSQDIAKIISAIQALESPASIGLQLERILPEKECNQILTQIAATPAYNEFVIIWMVERKRNTNSQFLHELFAGYFIHLAGLICQDDYQSRKLLKTALQCYSLFLDHSKPDPDAAYFAQWQIGLVQEKLGVSWPEVEETLIAASKYSGLRGEAMKHIIQHYKQAGTLGIAYMYSSAAKQTYFNEYSPDMVWLADRGYYNWKILNYHASICSKIGNDQEAADTFNQLWEISQQHPEYFTQDQLQSIYQNQKAYQL